MVAQDPSQVPNIPPMIVRMRFLLQDGTPEGTVLAQFDDIPAAAIPFEYSVFRIRDKEGTYQVIEGGIMYFYEPPRYVSVSVAVSRVGTPQADWDEDA